MIVDSGNQSGIALIQVLLITTIISLLAIRFTDTARNQLDIASKFEDRIRAQLLARSAINELIFIELSDNVQSVRATGKEEADLQSHEARINYWGETFAWGENISITMQDLNGLAPQRYPDHPIWRRLLHNLGLASEDVDRYLGEFTDIQDPDVRSWRFGDIEPGKTSAGKPYLNGYAQNNVVLRWVFAESPGLLQKLLDFSDVDAPPRTNILHSPAPLIRVLFDPETANTIIVSRNQNALNSFQLNQLLPPDFTPESTSRYTSDSHSITITAQVGNTVWRERNVVRLSPRAQTPFGVLSGS
jgi:general secretion pathway protein K